METTIKGRTNSKRSALWMSGLSNAAGPVCLCLAFNAREKEPRGMLRDFSCKYLS